MDRKLLILDLDETLIFASRSPLPLAADFEVGPYHVHRRPHLEAFLAFLRDRFEVAVWTSSSQDYAQGVVAQLFSKDFPLSFVWDRRRCTTVFDPVNRDYFQVKNLGKLKRRGYRLEHVVMIDDTPEKLMRHYGNHLRVAAFLGDPQDSELRDIQPFLAYLSEQENVRQVEKRGWRSFRRDR